MKWDCGNAPDYTCIVGLLKPKAFLFPKYKFYEHKRTINPRKI